MAKDMPTPAKVSLDTIITGLQPYTVERTVRAEKPEYKDSDKEKKNPINAARCEPVDVKSTYDFNGCTLRQIIKYCADSLVIQQQTGARAKYFGKDNHPDDKTFKASFKKIAAEHFTPTVKVKDLSANSRTRDPVESMLKAVGKKKMSKEQIAALVKSLSGK